MGSLNSERMYQIGDDLTADQQAYCDAFANSLTSSEPSKELIMYGLEVETVTEKVAGYIKYVLSDDDLSKDPDLQHVLGRYGVPPGVLEREQVTA